MCRASGTARGIRRWALCATRRACADPATAADLAGWRISPRALAPAASTIAVRSSSLTSPRSGEDICRPMSSTSERGLMVGVTLLARWVARYVSR
eukprot:8303193-Pyramimonas_sp.AAC.1